MSWAEFQGKVLAEYIRLTGEGRYYAEIWCAETHDELKDQFEGGSTPLQAVKLLIFDDESDGEE